MNNKMKKYVISLGTVAMVAVPVVTVVSCGAEGQWGAKEVTQADVDAAQRNLVLDQTKVTADTSLVLTEDQILDQALATSLGFGQLNPDFVYTISNIAGTLPTVTFDVVVSNEDPALVADSSINHSYSATLIDPLQAVNEAQRNLVLDQTKVTADTSLVLTDGQVMTQALATSLGFGTLNPSLVYTISNIGGTSPVITFDVVVSKTSPAVTADSSINHSYTATLIDPQDAVDAEQALVDAIEDSTATAAEFDAEFNDDAYGTQTAIVTNANKAAIGLNYDFKPGFTYTAVTYDAVHSTGDQASITITVSKVVGSTTYVGNPIPDAISIDIVDSAPSVPSGPSQDAQDATTEQALVDAAISTLSAPAKTIAAVSDRAINATTDSQLLTDLGITYSFKSGYEYALTFAGYTLPTDTTTFAGPAGTAMGTATVSIAVTKGGQSEASVTPADGTITFTKTAAQATAEVDAAITWPTTSSVTDMNNVGAANAVTTPTAFTTGATEAGFGSGAVQVPSLRFNMTSFANSVPAGMTIKYTRPAINPSDTSVVLTLSAVRADGAVSSNHNVTVTLTPYAASVNYTSSGEAMNAFLNANGANTNQGIKRPTATAFTVDVPDGFSMPAVGDWVKSDALSTLGDGVYEAFAAALNWPVDTDWDIFLYPTSGAIAAGATTFTAGIGFAAKGTNTGGTETFTYVGGGFNGFAFTLS